MRRRAMSKRLLEEEGFTLSEMMVTIMIMIVVLFALYSIFDMGIRVFSFGNDKVEATENARLGLERMEREIRTAYPVDKLATTPEDHLFFVSGTPGTPTLPPTDPAEGLDANQSSIITFGNDLPQGTDAPNRHIYDTGTGIVDPGEEITYQLNGSTLERITNGGDPQPVVEHVAPGGLRFDFLKSNLAAYDLVPVTEDADDNDTLDGTDAEVVRITLTINKDGRTQTLTTDVDLKNGVS
jgi:type II secretory pathway component PulJ